MAPRIPCFLRAGQQLALAAGLGHLCRLPEVLPDFSAPPVPLAHMVFDGRSRRVLRAYVEQHPFRSWNRRTSSSWTISAPTSRRLFRQMIQAAGARLWYLPPYSPDLNPIEQAFAKIKHWMRRAQKRSIEDTWRHIGHLVATIDPGECDNYFANAGYASVKS